MSHRSRTKSNANAAIEGHYKDPILTTNGGRLARVRSEYGDEEPTLIAREIQTSAACGTIKSRDALAQKPHQPRTIQIRLAAQVRVLQQVSDRQET